MQPGCQVRLTWGSLQCWDSYNPEGRQVTSWADAQHECAGQGRSTSQVHGCFCHWEGHSSALTNCWFWNVAVRLGLTVGDGIRGQ